VQVASALQRVGTSAVAPQACLTAGLGQWLGLAVVAKHGEVEQASVHVQSLPGPSSGDAATAGRAFVPMTIDPSHGGWLQPLEALPGMIVLICQHFLRLHLFSNFVSWCS